MISKRIAVLMTCHNRKDKTLSCLMHLHLNPLPPGVGLSIYLVDDGSTDGTADAVRAAYPSVVIVHGNGEMYWNQGMIRAWKSAEIEAPDFYLWLNDDTELYEDAIQSLWSTSLEHLHQAIVVGSTSATLNGVIPSYGGRDKNGALMSPNNTYRSCHTFNGNCVLIPSYVHNKLGTHSHQYSHSFGDFDYGYRASHAGIKRVVAPGFVGWCAPHDRAPRWSNPSTPVLSRLKALYSPLGCPPKEQFHFDLVRSNILVAILHFFTIHLRALTPQLWSHAENYSDQAAT